MTGMLYGVGVGPGDPDLITKKAVKAIERCQVLAVPETGPSRTVALDIAKQAADLEGKEILSLKISMTRDPELLRQSRDGAAQKVMDALDQGKDVAFLTLGDPTIYSTYLYTHRRVLAKGYEAQIIPGVPSFCAVAACLNEGLVENAQPLHVIPASYAGTEEALSLPGTKVLMKTGKAIGKVKEQLKQHGLYDSAKMVQNCGMENQQIHQSLDEADENASYFSILVIKDSGEEEV
ncbi:MAG: precorrin-2 C(20)-methyltransferase [Massiliimalia sp.]|jgi:precorrin-2/cobalt-factor-2 C20-methyltransferase